MPLTGYSLTMSWRRAGQAAALGVFLMGGASASAQDARDREVDAALERIQASVERFFSRPSPARPPATILAVLPAAGPDLRCLRYRRENVVHNLGGSVDLVDPQGKSPFLFASPVLSQDRGRSCHSLHISSKPTAFGTSPRTASRTVAEDRSQPAASSDREFRPSRTRQIAVGLPAALPAVSAPGRPFPPRSDPFCTSEHSTIAGSIGDPRDVRTGFIPALAGPTFRKRVSSRRGDEPADGIAGPGS